MKRVVTILLALSLALGMMLPAIAQESQNEMTRAFNTELVSKVKKSCIYIWAMSPGGVGTTQAAWIGSGVIFMADEENDAAYALTNHHVANNTTVMQVETWDHGTFRAELIATEPGIDSALIKLTNISREDYEPCVLGDSDQVMTGELCLAVGAPGNANSVNSDRSDPMISFGLHQTTTMSVITGRQNDPWSFMGAWVYWQRDLGRQVMTNLPWRFCVQAAINGGNSGGPLFNSAGECIGLNHAHFGGAGSQNENYTIPINFAKNFAFQVLKNEKYELPWLGIDVFMPDWIAEPSQIDEFQQRYFDPKTLEVLSVRDDSPAAEAEVVSKNARDRSEGLRRGDRILQFDGRIFDTSYDLRLYVFNLPIGKEVPLTVKRGKDKIDMLMKIGVKRTYNSEFSI